MNRATTRMLAAFFVVCLGASAVGLSTVAHTADAASVRGSADVVGATDATGAANVTDTADVTDAANVTGTAEVTYVEDDVTENTTWSSEEGPYRIAADVTIEEGATLHVEPGTTIQPAADIEITVEGNLSAAGTEKKPITVTTATKAPADVRWASIRYEGTPQSHLSLSHVTIARATNGITVGSSVGRVDLSAVTVRNVERNGIRVVTATGTPKLTVEDSTFTDVGKRGVAVTPGTGAVGDAKVTSNSSDPGNRTEHQLRLALGADTTMDTFRVAYRGHGKVDDLDRSSFRKFGLDLNGNGSIDRSLKPLVETVDNPTGNGYEIRLARTVTVPAGASVVAAYDHVVNPRTYGTYPVAVSLRTNGVDQTATTTLPFDLRSSGDQHGRDAEESRAGGFSITDSTFDSVGQQGVFVAADTARRFEITGNSFTNVRGSGITLRGRTVRSIDLDRNRISGVGDGADGVRVAAQRVDGLTLHRNRISGADAGVGFYARNENVDRVRFSSNVVTRSTTGVRVRHRAEQYSQHVSMTVADNEISNNDRRGFSIDAPLTRLSEVTVRGNTVTGNGKVGMLLSGHVVSGLTLRDNVVESNGNAGVGVTGRRVVGTTVTNNTVAENRGHGLSIRTRVVVHNVTVAENRVFDNAGVGIDVNNQLTHAGAVNLTRNVVAANAYGVRIAGAFGSRVVDNAIVYNTYGLDAPVRTPGYQTGTGIVVEEGDAGAIFRTGDVNEALVELIDDPEVEAMLDGRAPGDYTVVLRPGKEGDVWEREGAALGVRSLSDGIPTGVVLRKDDDDRPGVVVRGNDVYGHRRGMTVNVSTLVDANTTTRLFVNATRTVVAERNYWGAEAGPTHSSIHPEGTGDLVVTRRGWVDFIPAASSPRGQEYHRPVANVTVSPNPSAVGDSVVVSGRASSDGDGRVASYRFVVEGTAADSGEPTVTTSQNPNVTVSFAETGRYNVSLVVEDEMGVESATSATATASVREETTTTATTTATNETNETNEAAQRDSNATATTTATLRTNSESGFFPPLAVFTTVGGLLGLILYGVALLLGAYGALQTLRRAGVAVSGKTINGLAVAGVLVWAVSGLLGTDGLLGVSLGGVVVWVAGIVLLWAATKFIYD